MRFRGEKLRELRQGRKWDQHRLAEEARAHATGINQSQISRYENGQEPSGRNALALAKALKVRVDDLYESDDDAEAASLMPLAAEQELLEALRPLAQLLARATA